MIHDDLGEGIGYRVDAQGRGTTYDWKADGGARPAGTYEWVHIDLRTEGARTWLEERSGLRPLVVEAMLAEETRPRSLAVDESVVLVLRGVNLNPGANPEDMVALRIYVEEGRVITARRRPLMAVRDVRATVDRGAGPGSVGDLLVEISERLVERMSGVLTELNESVDAVEEALVESPIHAQRTALTSIRREAIALRRYLAPQRDALTRLYGERLPWFSDLQRLRLREVTDTTIRYIEDLEAARERTAVTQEELNGRLAEQLNHRMYALAIVAAIFLPLGFVTGLLGINVGGMPGADDPTAFAIVCGGLVAIGVGQFALLRHLKWF